MTPAEPAPGQPRGNPLPSRRRVVPEGGRDQRRDRCAGDQDAAVWHQEPDLPDPGAPSGSSNRPPQLPDSWTSWAATALRLPRSAAASFLSGDVNEGCRDEAVALPVVVILGADVTESGHARGSRRWSPWVVLVAALVVGGCTSGRRVRRPPVPPRPPPAPLRVV